MLKLQIYCLFVLNINERNDKRFNNRDFFFLHGHLSETSLINSKNVLKWQGGCNIFTKVVPLQALSRSSHRECLVKECAFKAFKPRTLLKRDSNTGIFLWNLRNLILKNICERLLLTKLSHDVFFWLLWRHRFLYNSTINY